MHTNENPKSDFEKILQSYFTEISKFPLLTMDEEIDLATKIKNGDNRALSKLVLSNLRFVVSVAKEFRGYGLQFGDLINQGNLGLIKAAKRYDVSKGFKFISYAVWWIKQSIWDSINNHLRIVRLPPNQLNNLKKLDKIKEELEQKYERNPTLHEVAAALNISEEEIYKLNKIDQQTITLYDSLSLKEKKHVIDTVKDNKQEEFDTRMVKESFLFDIYNVLKSLSPREAEILCMYYGIFVDNPLTLEEISKKYQLTRERVRQLKESALERIRNLDSSDTLREYL